MADSKENDSRSWGWKDQSFYVFVFIENNEALSGWKNKRILQLVGFFAENKIDYSVTRSH